MLSLPCWRATAVGIRSTPTTTMISQSGPADRKSGREKRNPPTASRASIAGQRGSKCFEVFGIVLHGATPAGKQSFSVVVQKIVARSMLLRVAGCDRIHWLGLESPCRAYANVMHRLP